MARALENLVMVLSRLPGIGRRSAERIAYRLLRDGSNAIHELTSALQNANERLDRCTLCGNVTERDANPCPICQKPGRNDGLLCVVEEPGDISLMERSGGYNGRYFCLLGRLSPINDDTIPPPRLAQLLNRIRDHKVQEVLLAMNSDMEGDATASYLHEQLENLPVKITRLAFGLPAGSALTYSDPVTLARAIQGRQELP